MHVCDEPLELRRMEILQDAPIVVGHRQLMPRVHHVGVVVARVAHVMAQRRQVTTRQPQRVQFLPAAAQHHLEAVRAVRRVRVRVVWHLRVVLRLVKFPSQEAFEARQLLYIGL